jgi:hypothetical protein
MFTASISSGLTRKYGDKDEEKEIEELKKLIQELKVLY